MNPKISKRSALIGLALLSVCATAGVAQAAPVESDIRTVQVRYSDLDLSRPDDAMRLYRRIKSAARRACGEADPRNLNAHMQYEECYGRAVENAVEKVHSNTLTALHRSRTQHSVHG